MHATWWPNERGRSSRIKTLIVSGAGDRRDFHRHVDLRLCLSCVSLAGSGGHFRTQTAKDHGLGRLVEGVVLAGDRALVVDDVLTSGGSVVKAIVAAREAGLEVKEALVIVDRKEQDGRARVEQLGVRVASLPHD